MSWGGQLSGYHAIIASIQRPAILSRQSSRSAETIDKTSAVPRTRSKIQKIDHVTDPLSPPPANTPVLLIPTWR